MVSEIFPVPMLNLHQEYLDLKPDIDDAIGRVIASGAFFLGPELAAFEAEFAAWCGVAHAVGVGSGTAALFLALRACGIGPGDEVITVPNTDIPTTMTISQCGATFTWVDVDPQTFNIDPGKIEAAITPRTRAILPVHLFGCPADMEPILEIARTHRLRVVEDAALALGATYRGRRVGGFGDVAAFSLAPGKILGAYGDAGAVVTNDPEIAERVRILRNYGHDPRMEEDRPRNSPPRDWNLLEEAYNERLDSLQAAILRAKLPTLDRRIDARRCIAKTYDRELAKLDLVTPYEPSAARHVYRAYPVLVRERDRVRQHLQSRQIATQTYYTPPLHLQPAYRHLGFKSDSFPGSEHIGQSLLCLPIFPEMTESQIGAVVDALVECVPRNADS
jgi:dTDP-4-amino-4,6-dideoxygalactose transaminase